MVDETHALQSHFVMLYVSRISYIHIATCPFFNNGLWIYNLSR